MAKVLLPDKSIYAEGGSLVHQAGYMLCSTLVNRLFNSMSKS